MTSPNDNSKENDRLRTRNPACIECNNWDPSSWDWELKAYICRVGIQVNNPCSKDWCAKFVAKR